MWSPSRRWVLRSGAALAALPAAHAETPAAETVATGADDGPVAARRIPASGNSTRGAVLLLHGARDIELDPQVYARYADALAAAGIDAYLVRYFTAADTRALDRTTSTPQGRGAYDAGRFAGWSRRVSAMITAVLARPESTRRIGLLGFSLGGFVAAQAAADDMRVNVLAVLYGGLPDAMVARVKHLPPTIELHGDADRTVPPAKGAELVRLARSLGAPAEQITYPGRGHGFDFSDKDPMTADAVARVVRFFRLTLPG
jgi:carboxymethylenebutenolidase